MAVFLMTDSLKALALSGISFGLGCACKWTCVYAGAGLAVLWAGYWIGHRKRGFPAFVKNCLFCVGFFVVMPCLIYYLAYIPYGRAAGIKGVFNREYLDIVLSNQTYMFTYHAGLVAEHPYSSRWYQWLLDIRPILYYLQYFDDGSRSSFGAFLNPVLCWGGLLALAVCLYRAIFRLDRTAMFILIGYLAQLLNELGKYNVKCIAFDPWGMWDLKNRFGKYDSKLMEYQQSIRFMSVPTKDLEARVLRHELNFLGNPVIRWMFRNVVIYRDPNANIKLDKARSRNKIDGVVALVDAIGGLLTKTANNKQAYSNHTLRTIQL